MVKNIVIGLLVVGLIATGDALYHEQQINNSLKYSADRYRQIATDNNLRVLKANENISSLSAQLEVIKNQPTPSPKVVYQTQVEYQTDPNLDYRLRQIQNTQDQIRSQQQLYQIQHP